MKKLLALMALWIAVGYAFGLGCDSVNVACYVRAGASGSASGADWTNAFTALPSSLTRGVTYYVATGSYGAHVFGDTDSGTLPITVKAPTIASHGTATGWSNAFQGQATFACASSCGTIFSFTTDYYVINGVYCTGIGGPTSAVCTSGYGFKVDNSGSHQAGTDMQGGLGFAGSPIFIHDVTLSYIEDNGTHPTSDASVLDTQVDFEGGSYNLLFDHLYVHDGWVPFFLKGNHHSASGFGTGNNVTIQYSYVAHNYNSSAFHSEGCSCSEGLTNFTIRYNYWVDMLGTAYNATPSGASFNTGNQNNGPWDIYGNVFAATAAGISGLHCGTGDGMLAIFDATFTGDVHFLNNDIVNFSGCSALNNGFGMGLGFTTPMTKLYSQNNLFWSTDVVTVVNTGSTSFNGATFTLANWEDNAWFQIPDSSASNDTSGTKQVSSSNPFVSSSTSNWTLATDTTAGTSTSSLVAGNSVDMNGVTRGVNGTWDRGAFQLVTGGCPATYNFPGSGIPLNSSDWTQTALGGTSVLNEASGTAIPSTASTQGFAVWVGAACSPGNDQYSQVVAGTTITGVTGPVVRGTAASGNGYLWLLRNGTIYSLSALAGTGLITCPSYTVGNTYKLVAHGTSISGYENGTLVCTGTDSTYSTGNAGILVDQRSGSSDTLSAFEVGVGLAPPPLPLNKPDIAYSTATVTAQDGFFFNYPGIGATPTLQQVEPIIFGPGNFLDVITAAATPAPTCVRLDGVAPTATTPGTCDAPATTYTYGGSNTLTLTGSVTIKAISTGVGRTNSAVATSAITIYPFYPAPGTYSYSPLVATLTGTMGSNLIYTTNGSTPTASGTCTATNGTAVANGTQITIPNSATTTVKFIPCVGGVTGALQTGVYIQRAPITWYVEPNSLGTRFSPNVTSGLCNGQANAAPVGSTPNQNCAYNDFRYLWDDDSGAVFNGAWVIGGGDTVMVGGCTASVNQVNPSNPTCRIGWDNGNGGGSTNLWCQFVGNNTCFNPTIPSGSTSQPTRILGTNYAACATGGQTNPRNYASQLSQLFGGFGLTWTFDLRDTQNVTIDCIEFTTHNGGAAGQCDIAGSPLYPRGCSTNPPIDDFARNGLFTNRNTAGVKLQDVSIHGFSSAGMFGPLGNGIVMTRVYDGFNAFAAWNMDDGVTTPNGLHSTINAGYVTMIGNGCNEEWPIVHTGFPALSCYGTINNGFGDAWSGQDTQMDAFILDHNDIEYNTKDATLGPHPMLGNFTVTNSILIGSMGSQMKWISDINGTATVLNNEIIGNCARLQAAPPGAPQTYYQASGLGGAYLNSSDFCRAGGNTFASNVRAGATWRIANNTIVNYGLSNFDLFIDCGIPYFHPDGTCGTAVINQTNNIYLGYQLSGGPGFGPAVFGGADSSVTTIFLNNLGFANQTATGPPCGTGGNSCNTDPLLVSQPAQFPGGWTNQTFLDNFNFNPTSGSPVNGAGTTYTGILPTDFAGNTQTTPPVIGALIFASGPPTVAIPTASPVAGTYSSTQSVTLSTTTGGATICYTTNGTTPAATTPGTCDVGSTTYAGAITVAVTTTIKALGTLSGDTNSSVATFAYTITPIVATPTASPVAGTYTSTQSVTLSDSTGGASICYTTDGSTPTAPVAGTCSGGTTLTYSSAITVATTTTIKAIGTLSGNTNSTVGTFAYIIAPIVATPTCSPVAGTYSSTQTVTCSTVTSGATICGTTNGSTPTSSPAGTCSNGTSGPFVISTTATLKAIGTKSGDTDSSIFSGLYTITTPPPFIINGIIIIGDPILK